MHTHIYTIHTHTQYIHNTSTVHPIHIQKHTHPPMQPSSQCLTCVLTRCLPISPPATVCPQHPVFAKVVEGWSAVRRISKALTDAKHGQGGGGEGPPNGAFLRLSLFPRAFL